jgi:phosphatidylinositol alpha-mannosyltransferase
MRVGLVCPYDLGVPGGVQAQVLGLAEHLRARGDEARVIGPGLSDDEDSVGLGSTLSLPGNDSMAPISLDPRVRARIERAVRDVDLLHVHEPLMPAVSLLALRAGKPTVATFHADPGAWVTGLYRMLGSRIRRVLGANVARITAVSNTAASPLPAALDIDIIPNGVDVSAFDSDVDRLPARVSFLGRDERRKGLGVLLEAWPRVESEVPSAELVVMGANRGIPGITWKGRVDNDTKARLLASSSVYVAPNLGGESFGVVLVEAMAAGTPVIASDLKSFRDVGGEAIRYFPKGDSGALAEAIVTVLDDQDARGEMSVKGRVRAAEFDAALS